MNKQETKKNGKPTEDQKKWKENMERRMGQMELQLQQLLLKMEETISRLNRIDQMQIQMDVYLRNHAHQQQGMNNGTR